MTRSIPVVASFLVLLSSHSMADMDSAAQDATNWATANPPPAVQTQDPTAVVPQYTTNPPQANFYNNPILMEEQAAIDRTLSDSAAMIDSGASNASSHTFNPLADPMFNVPEADAGCQDVTENVPGTYETKICRDYRPNWTENCTRDLGVDVQVNETCSLGGVTNTVTAYKNGGDQMHARAICTESPTAHTLQFYAHGGRGACVGWQNYVVDPTGIDAGWVYTGLMARPHWNSSCRYLGVYVRRNGCDADNCSVSVGWCYMGRAGGVWICGAAPGVNWSHTLTYPIFKRSFTETDNWTNNCAGLEARALP